MNILVLLGSPVEDGNTATVVSMLQEQLEHKHEFEVIRVVDLEIEFCDGCNDCQESGELLACKYKDDFNATVQKMRAADLVLYASPLYVFSLSAQLKRFIDRMYSAVKDFKRSNSTSYLEGLHQMLLLTCIGPAQICDPCINTFKLMTETQMGHSIGEFVVPFCKSEKRLLRNGSYAVSEMVEAIEALEQSLAI